jgi:hypothetical protein
LWRVAELEEKLRHAEADQAGAKAVPDEVAAVRAARDRAIEQFHRGAAAHANEVHQLQSSVAEQAALVAELEDSLRAAEARAAAAAPPAPSGNGHGPVPQDDIQEAVAELETRLREEMSTLSAIEESLARARDEAARGAHGVDPNVRADLERALAAKDSQLIEGRLELARLRRDSEARQAQLEREISDLRARLNPGGASPLSEEHSQGAQLILMHSTLANIRRRSARLRDELEGFRRRLDTLPPGAISSILEEIGEDLAEFAK